MLSYKQALKKILKHSFTLKAKHLGLRESLGLVAAENIFSQAPFPSFDNSAVDGYAVRLLRFARNDVIARRPRGRRSNLNLKLQGEVQAGEVFDGNLKPGHAVRIFTGAPVPKGARAVVMQEDTQRINGHVNLLRLPESNDNIRFRGEDFQKGTMLVKKGTVLGPAHLALLATVGYQKIPVYPSAKVAILATGSELLKENEKQKIGKIFDSNTILLEALVKKNGGVSYPFSSVGDQPREIRAQVRRGLRYDLFLISGGVSVGQYDFVKEILKKEGVQEIFWKVDIKPGKPIFFGKKNQTLVFGLPGNPVSAFVTFEEFVKPAIFEMQGMRKKSSEQIQGTLTKGFQNGSRLHFVRAQCQRRTKGFQVTPLKGQGSHMIASLASSNALLQVEPNVVLKKNQLVSVKLIGGE